MHRERCKQAKTYVFKHTFRGLEFKHLHETIQWRLFFTWSEETQWFSQTCVGSSEMFLQTQLTS